MDMMIRSNKLLKGRDKDVINCRGCQPEVNLNELLPIILLIVVFYFMIIRPQRKEKENRDVASLAVGDNVTTIGGICGKITSLREDIVI